MDKLRVSQINLQHSREATGELVSVLTGKPGEICLVQEPYVFRNRVRGLGSAGYNIIVGSEEDERPRTCIVASKDLRVVPLPQMGTRDVTAVILELEVSKVVRRIVVASVYLPYDVARLPPTEEFENLIAFGSDRGFPVIIGCDANAHHIVWGSSDINARGEALLAFLASTDLEVLNRGGEPTFVNSIRQEVIDITLVSSSMRVNISDWRISTDISTSDHRMIRFEVRCERPEEVHRRNPKATDWKIYSESLARQIGEQETIDSSEELEKQVSCLEKVVISAYEEACPLKAVRARRLPWWSRALENLRRDTRRAFNRAVKGRTDALWSDYKAAKGKFKKELRRSKRSSWQTYCGEMETLSESARLMRILSCETKEAVGSLRRADGTWTTSSKETLKLLLETHFPGESADQAVPEARQPVTISVDWQSAERIATDSAIAWAVNEFSPFKAAGPDGIFPALLQRGLDILLPWIGRIFRASLALGYVPKGWRHAKVVFIPKAGKKDYTAAKSFRPISLTSFLLKGLERIVDRFLVEGSLVRYPFHNNQHAYRQGRSTETALHAAVYRVERALQYKEFALAVFFDIEGAFDKAKTTTICDALMAREVTPVLVNWVRSSLEVRRVRATLGDCQVDIGVRGGCPQGSCLSPHLWCLIMDSLLENLTLEGFCAQAYADDGLVIVTGRFLNVVCDRMQVACGIIERWCKVNGLSVNPTKTEMILFTKRRKLEGFRAPTMYGKPLAKSQEVKYLGVTLDSKLTWRAHVERVVDKSIATLWQLRRAVGRTWGMSPQILYWLYTAVIRPRVQYGSVVWWPAVERTTIALRLAKVQRLASLGITGAMRTTPTAALDILLGLPSLSIWIRREAMASHLRMRDLGCWLDRGEGIGHALIAKKAERDIPISAIKVIEAKDRLRLNRKYTLTLPTKEEWVNQQVKFPPDSLVCYTDGSRLTSRQSSGAGISLDKRGVQQSISLGKHATVFQAEVFAILTAATLDEVSNGPERTVYVCSDSQAALKAVCSARTRSALVQECGNALEKLAETKTVRLVWVPGHSGIPGNEEADELARLGAEGTCIGPEPFLGLTRQQVKSALNDWTDKTMKDSWRSERGCRQAKDLIAGPDRLRSAWLLGKSRHTLNLLIGALTGHCRLRRHLALLGVEDDSICLRCGREDETSLHLLAECEAFGALRFSIFGTPTLQREEVGSLSWADILTFVRRSGRFAERARGGHPVEEGG